MVEQRGYQTPATETISMDVNHPDCQGSFFIGILDFTQIVTLGEFTQNPGARIRLGGNDEVGASQEDFKKNGTVIETCI